MEGVSAEGNDAEVEGEGGFRGDDSDTSGEVNALSASSSSSENAVLFMAASCRFDDGIPTRESGQPNGIEAGQPNDITPDAFATSAVGEFEVATGARFICGPEKVNGKD